MSVFVICVAICESKVSHFYVEFIRVVQKGWSNFFEVKILCVCMISVIETCVLKEMLPASLGFLLGLLFNPEDRNIMFF
jgi:hypothetical protein